MHIFQNVWYQLKVKKELATFFFRDENLPPLGGFPPF